MIRPEWMSVICLRENNAVQAVKSERGACGCATTTPFSSTPGGICLNLKELTADIMREHIGTKFHARIDDRDVILVLEKVHVVLEKHISRMGRDSFNVVFSGPKDLLIKQGTFEMTHEVLGPMAIFIVPIARHEDGRFQFEAIFT